MGTVSKLRAVREARGLAAGRFVTCEHCGERHPIVKLAGGNTRCVTAFDAGGYWFCLNRGCRAAWLARQTPEAR